MTELWMPLLAGLLTAAVAGPLGSLLLWRRMAYFGDSLAHASLFGVALALLWHLPVGPVVVVFSLGLAWLLGSLLDREEHGADTWLAITAYSGLSLALLLSAVSHGDGHGHELEAYLFGEISQIDTSTLLLLTVGLVAVGLALLRFWPAWLAMAVHEESAQIDGWAVKPLRRLLLLLLAAVVALGAKVMGVLLISALLVMPAAAARYLATHPSEMAIKASLLGSVAVISGTLVGIPSALPVAPLVVVFCLAGLCFSVVWQRLKR